MYFKFLFLAFFSLFLTACQDNDKALHSESTLLRVKVVSPKSVQFSPTLSLSGTIVAKERISISTSLQGLQILSVRAEEGDWVKKGQVLATLENANVSSQFQQHTAQLAKAKANLSAQQANLKEAESLLKRYRQLIKNEAVSRQELESQKAKVAAAQSAVKSAQAEIAEIQALLADSRNQRNKTEVLAPADGIIIQRNAESGMLTDTNALFVLAKDGVIEVQADANSAEMAKLSKGLNVSIQVHHETLLGKIRLLSSELSTSSRLGKVYIQLDKPSALLVGAYANVDVQLPHYRANIALPLSAVSFQDKQHTWVMRVNAQNEVVRQSVEIGEIHQNMVEIRSGLSSQDVVVKQAASFLDEGDRVQVQFDEEEK